MEHTPIEVGGKVTHFAAFLLRYAVRFFNKLRKLPRWLCTAALGGAHPGPKARTLHGHVQCCASTCFPDEDTCWRLLGSDGQWPQSAIIPVAEALERPLLGGSSAPSAVSPLWATVSCGAEYPSCRQPLAASNLVPGHPLSARATLTVLATSRSSHPGVTENRVCP
jgi:hypothetical protein